MLNLVPLNQINHNGNNNNTSDGNNTAVDENTNRRSSSRKARFCVLLLKYKCFVLPLILFILTLGVLIIVLIEENNPINHSEDNLQINQTFIVQTQNQNNETVTQSEDYLLEKNATIEQLNNTLIESKNERSRINTVVT